MKPVRRNEVICHVLAPVAEYEAYGAVTALQGLEGLPGMDMSGIEMGKQLLVEVCPVDDKVVLPISPAGLRRICMGEQGVLFRPE